MERVAEGGVRAVTLAATGERAGYSRGIVKAPLRQPAGLLDALTGEQVRALLAHGLRE